MKQISLFVSSSSVMFFAVLICTRCLKISLQTPVHKKERTQSYRAQWLAQSGVSITPTQYWISTALCGTTTFTVITLFSHTPLIAGVIAVATSFIPYTFISKKRAIRSRELIEAWPDALRDIAATISAGHSLTFALRALASVGPEQLKEHMARFSSLERTMGFVSACEIVRNEMNDATTDRILEVFIVAHERGGRVIREIIEDLVESITEDIALAATITTESIEMKINSRAVVLLPWCVLVLLTLSGGMFREFYQSSAGAIVIAIGAIMSGVGIALLSRLTHTQIEKRVFAYGERT